LLGLVPSSPISSSISDSPTNELSFDSYWLEQLLSF
jgi:hypothetical protein